MRSRALTNYVRAPVEILHQDLIITDLKELTHKHELEYLPTSFVVEGIVSVHNEIATAITVQLQLHFN